MDFCEIVIYGKNGARALSKNSFVSNGNSKKILNEIINFYEINAPKIKVREGTVGGYTNYFNAECIEFVLLYLFALLCKEAHIYCWSDTVEIDGTFSRDSKTEMSLFDFASPPSYISKKSFLLAKNEINNFYATNRLHIKSDDKNIKIIFSVSTSNKRMRFYYITENAFGLNKLEKQVLELIHKKQNYTVSSVAEELNYSKPAIYKALKSLKEKRLI